MSILFRGDMEPPKFEHGDIIKIGDREGVVQHRRYHGRNWSYGLIMDGWPGIYWYSI